MPFLKKRRRDRVFISILVNSISYETNPDASFQIECGFRKKEKHHTALIPSSPTLTNQIGQTFNFIIIFKRNQNKTWKKKNMKFVLISNINRKFSVIAKWKKDISILSNSSSLDLVLSKQNKLLGRVDLNLTISKGHSERKKISDSNTMNQIRFERLSDSSNPTHSSTQRYTLAELISQDCSFFTQNDPEFINQAPQFTINVISHCAKNISQMNLEFVIFQFHESFFAIKQLSEEIDIYAIVSIFHFVSSFVKKRWATSAIIENFTDFLNLYFMDLINRMKERFDDEILDDCHSLIAPNIICQWIVKRGSGTLCQAVFTGILFLFSASYGKSICQILASSFGIREKIFRSLIDELPEIDEIEEPLVNGTIYAILIQLGVDIG